MRHILFAGAALCFVLVLLVVVGTDRIKVVGPSMEPTLRDAELIIINRMSYILSKPNRGDVILFSRRQEEHFDYIKRVIGLPGETLEISHGEVWIDGHPLAEPYVKGTTLGSSPSWLLGPGEYFVMGDNRTVSKDSRNFGGVPFEKIIGCACLNDQPKFRDMRP